MNILHQVLPAENVAIRRCSWFCGLCNLLRTAIGEECACGEINMSHRLEHDEIA